MAFSMRGASMLFLGSMRAICLAFSIVLCSLFFLFAEATEPKLLAVFDLASDGTVSIKSIKAISDRISELVQGNESYTQFNREMLPELFNQLALDQSALVCSDQQCLILLGNLIGAAAVLGGSITTTGKQTTIELNLVDVSGKRTINKVLLTSVAKKSDFIENELPALVKNLLSSRTNASPLASKPSVKRTSVLSNPLLYTGTLLVGGAAATAYYFLVYKKSDDHENAGQPVNEPLSLDDIPIPTRGIR